MTQEKIIFETQGMGKRGKKENFSSTGGGL